MFIHSHAVTELWQVVVRWFELWVLFVFLCISFHFPAILRHRYKCQTTECDIYSRNCTMSSYITGILMISKNFTLVFGKDIN